MPVKSGVTRLLTRTPGANDREAVWSPDGSTIAYISDLGGETEIWVKPAESTGEARRLTSGADTYIRTLDRPPTARPSSIPTAATAWWRWILPPSQKTLVTCPESEIRSFSFSPDSRWIAYTRP